MPPPNTPEEAVPEDNRPLPLTSLVDVDVGGSGTRQQQLLLQLQTRDGVAAPDDGSIIGTEDSNSLADLTDLAGSEDGDRGRSYRGNASAVPVKATAKATAEAEAKLDLRALDYVGSYDEHLDCAVCQTPLVEPRMTRCLHTFCRECFEHMLQTDDRCPLDRKPFQPFEDGPGVVYSCPAPPMVTSLLDNLQVRCPNARCDHVCARSLIEHHYEKDCPFTKVPCADKNCDKLVERHDAVNGRCLHRMVQCDYCSQSVELASIEDHYDTNCEQNAIRCQYCSSPIPKYRYGTHVANCPDRLVDCLHRTSGCTAVLKKKDSAEHERTCLYGMMVRMKRTHDSDMEGLKAALNASNARVRQLEVELATRPAVPAEQPWNLTNMALPPPPPPPPMMVANLPHVPPSLLAIQPMMEPGYYSSREEHVHAHAHAAAAAAAAATAAATAARTDGSMDDKVTRLMADFEGLNVRVETIERYVGDADTRQALRFLNELTPIREQIGDLYNNLGLMNMHVRRMTENFRQTMRQAGSEVSDAAVSLDGSGGPGTTLSGVAGTAGAVGTGSSTSTAMDSNMAGKQETGRRLFFNGQSRRMSDRENPPRL